MTASDKAKIANLINIILYSIMLGFLLSALTLIINWITILGVIMGLLLVGLTTKDFIDDNIKQIK